jgi:DNA polymerase V
MYYQQPDGVSVHDGFPNPAADNSLQPLDLNQLLIKNPIATYFVRVSGDVLLVDRSLKPKPSDRVVWVHQDSISTSSFQRMPVDAELWGVVTALIRQYRWRQP